MALRIDQVTSSLDSVEYDVLEALLPKAMVAWTATGSYRLKAKAKANEMSREEFKGLTPSVVHL